MNDLIKLADEQAAKYNLDPALFRAVINQESRWNVNAVSPAGAQGLGQAMPATAKNPGYGVKPMQDNTPQEQLRFSAEYLSAMIRMTGRVDHGLAAYNAGYGAVLKHKGIPPYSETQDYVKKILGAAGTEVATVMEANAEAATPFAKGQARRAAVEADPRFAQITGNLKAGDPDEFQRAVIARSEARERARAANVATAAEAREDAIANQTITFGLAQAMDAGARTDWQPDSALKDQEMSEGIVNYPDINSFVQGFRNEEDYHRRMGIARQRMEFAQRMGNATGWDVWKLAGNQMLGAMLDPVAAGASIGIGSALNAVRAGRAALAGSRAARVAANAVEGFVTDGAISWGIQGALNSETDWSTVLSNATFGASFGAGLSLPVQAAQAGRQARAMTDFDTAARALGEALDANAAPSHVAALQRSIDDARGRMMQIARQDGDDIVQQVWANAGPGASSDDIAKAVRSMRERKAAGWQTLDPVHEASPADVVPPRSAGDMQKGTETLDVAGMRLSAEATAVRKYAYDLWDEQVDPALKDMQQRMQDFYKMREAKLGDYAGLAKWLDSPGLVLQTSGSKVARMLGAHLFESASGIGKRTQSAALNYEILHSRLAHSYVPGLKEALLDGLKEAGVMSVVRHSLGGGRRDESAFWRAVMVERTAHRNAIRSKQEFQSTSSEPVQRAAKLLDNFWRESADHLEKVGMEEGTAIKTLGVTGHVPYRWDATRISHALRTDPETFGAFQSMIQEEFRNKVLDGMMRDLEANGRQMMDKKRADLEGNIAAVQDEIAKMEDARRVVDTVRGDAKAVADELSKLNQIRKVLLQTERELKEELKSLPEDAEAVSLDVEDILLTDLRTNLGDVPFTATGGSRIAEFRANPDIKEITVTDLIARIKATKGFKSEVRELNTLADALANDFADSGEAVPVFVTAKDSVGKDARGNDLRSHYFAGGNYVALTKVADLNNLTVERAVTALHELAHARTSRWLYKVAFFMRDAGHDPRKGWQPAMLADPEAAAKVGIPAEVSEAWNKLEAVRSVLMERFPEQVGVERGIGYAMKNGHELIAQVFNDPLVRAELEDIEMPGSRNLLRMVWEAVAGIFVRKGDKRTALSEVMEALDVTSGFQGRWVDREGMGIEFAPVRGKMEVEQQLAVIQAKKAEIDAQRKQMQTSKKQAVEAKQKIADTSGVKKLDALRLQLNNQKAQLADMQRDPLGYWGKQVESLRKASEAKADALTSSYLKQVIQDPDSRTKGMTLHASRLAEDLLNENWAGEKIDADLAEQFGTMLRERLADKSRTEFDLGRTRTVNGREVSLMDFMDLDGLSQVKSASHRVAGQVALAKMGVTDVTGVAAALEAARTDGATPDDIKALQFGFDFLNDSLDAGDHAAMHALRNMTYFTRMGKLGMSMVADVPQMVSTLGLSLALKTWGQSFLQHSFNGRTAFGIGGATDFAKQLAEAAPGALGRDHRLMTLVPDDPTSGAADRRGAGLLQRVSARGAQFTSWISGSNHINMAMHRALLPVLAEELLGAVHGKSVLNDVRLADVGMDAELRARVQAMMDKHDAGRRKGAAVNWDKWEDQLAADALIAVIHRAMFQTLQKSLLGESPQWMVDSAMGRVIGQFRRFGLTAAEKMTARQALGYQDSQALLTATMGLAWAGLLYYARVHVNAANREDADEYIEKQLEPMALTRGIMAMWNLSGLGADFASMGEMLFGGNQRVEASPAAALGTVKDIAGAAQGVGGLVTGEEEAGKAAAKVMRLLPGANSIPLTYLLNELQKD